MVQFKSPPGKPHGELKSLVSPSTLLLRLKLDFHLDARAHRRAIAWPARLPIDVAAQFAVPFEAADRAHDLRKTNVADVVI